MRSIILIMIFRLTLVNCQDTAIPTAFPIASDSAEQCLQALNRSGVVDRCKNSAGKLWPTIDGHEDNDWEERDTCCEQYDIIDCKINAVNTGQYCTGQSAKDALQYLQRMISYWAYGHCITIPYHSNICYQSTRFSTHAE